MQPALVKTTYIASFLFLVCLVELSQGRKQYPAFCGKHGDWDWCENGCCGDHHDKCCDDDKDDDDYDRHGHGGKVVIIVLAGLLGVALIAIVTGLVIVLCCQKRKYVCNPPEPPAKFPLENTPHRPPPHLLPPIERPLPPKEGYEPTPYSNEPGHALYGTTIPAGDNNSSTIFSTHSSSAPSNTAFPIYPTVQPSADRNLVTPTEAPPAYTYEAPDLSSNP